MSTTIYLSCCFASLLAFAGSQATTTTPSAAVATTPPAAVGHRFRKISNDSGCIYDTNTAVNGYYVPIGRCSNSFNNYSTVYIQQNRTSWSSDGLFIYVLFYGTFDIDQSVDNTNNNQHMTM